MLWLSAGMLGIALLVVLGCVDITRPDAGFSGFNLDGEGTAPAAFTALLLLAAAAGAAVLCRADPPRFAPLVAILGFMALEEVFFFHEILERRVAVDWQLLYLPLFLVAAGAWLLVVRDAPAVVRNTLVVSAAFLVVSQVLEALQWRGTVKVAQYNWYMVPEEAFEMIGSLTFAVALWKLVELGTAPRAVAAT